ncbi:MAG: dihydrofolate reductase [Lentisphaerae bacterium]|nr:dihydrofolate reductase [Lentisphaerota bacterium]
MTLSIICAVGRNGAIGRDNALLWHLPGDLPRFKRLTMGHPIIMGRRTFESIGRPLPGRLNLVVTRNADYRADGVEIFLSLKSAIERAMATSPPNGECFVIGGGELYAAAIDHCDRLYLTEVDDAPADADTFFPDYSDFTQQRAGQTEMHDGIAYRFVDRTRPPVAS